MRIFLANFSNKMFLVVTHIAYWTLHKNGDGDYRLVKEYFRMSSTVNILCVVENS